ncbi:MAG: UDP-N-acetylmuramoyl-tripeptide--D-alanyl-D-alanine ligase [Clostridia bacterium]|nr:UDP-N-acetylmuramoyl-tripeptide--D-alanyl-D-alanine ligase [Clostridia bacterium]
MILTFLYGICSVMMVILLYFNVSRYLHILQQTFYHLSDFFHSFTISKAYRIKMYDMILFGLMFFNLFVNHIWLKYGLLIFYGIVEIFSIQNTLQNKGKEKKKFNITFRVKVIYTFYFILTILMFVPFFMIRDITYLSILLSILSIYKVSSMVLVVFSHLLSLPIIVVENNRYIKEAKRIIQDHHDLKVIGITGSYGKTSTKNIINGILSEKYHTVMTPQSYNTTLGVTKTIRENIKPYTEVFVCEMGASRVGDIKEICKIVKPDISAITSIGPQHLSTFKKMENIIKEKFEIVKMAKEDSIAVLNVDNETINHNYLKYTENKKVLKYSLDSYTDYYVENIQMNENGSSFDVIIHQERIPIETKLLGKHNIYNILCAIMIAKYLGMENEEIRRAVKKIKPVEHRLELKYMGNILTLDDSFNSNPEGSKMALECLLTFQDKYKVLVTPGMVELGSKEKELNQKLGEYATKCDFVILVGEKTTMDIKIGMDKKDYQNYIMVESIHEAFDELTHIKMEHENLIALIENDLPDCYL